ncbi:hypothetical protein KOI35_27055 [Actinoplanes bogorensis]|uniref:Uncharacterized protein n=1 Tax=Paractinoplanes bogorensis TaxID=1610840 RepID=A0ABS5YUP3_9ACTN|nr:hypothetical protein [Actinoplanes bogorensis]MBU2667172.1 hypothetical protein [Actinoplanes bogorensis]
MERSRRLCWGVDVSGFSALAVPDQERTVRQLRAITEPIRRALAVGDREPLWQTTGDGELVVLPTGTDEPEAVAAVLGRFASALAGVTPRLRVRLALDQGIVHDTAGGLVADAINRMRRMLDSAELHAVLDDDPAADLAVAVSDEIHQSVVKQGYPAVPGRFRPARVIDSRHGAEIDVWMCGLPERGNPRLVTDPGAFGALQSFDVD